MRIATWNVNSLKARMEAVENWLQRAAADVLLMQETKLSDADAPLMAFGMLGYTLVHHGEGRWNGVAIAVREALSASERVTNFGDGPVRDSSAGAASDTGEDDFDPFDEARMLSVVISGEVDGRAIEPIRVASLYAPNGRVVDSPFYAGKLRWFERLRRWLDETRDPGENLLIGGDLHRPPAPARRWVERKGHGGPPPAHTQAATVATPPVRASPPP